MLKNVLKNFQMSKQYWGCLDKMSEVNFSPAETLDPGQGGSLVTAGLAIVREKFHGHTYPS